MDSLLVSGEQSEISEKELLEEKAAEESDLGVVLGVTLHHLFLNKLYVVVLEDAPHHLKVAVQKELELKVLQTQFVVEVQVHPFS